MYLLLILLVSPAFGRPSSDQLDVGADISNQLKIFIKFNNETGKLFLNSSVVENVVKMLLEAEKLILEMNTELKTLETQEMKFNFTYFVQYNKAKSNLRQTRQGLRKLAHRTVTDVRDLKILMENLDNDPVLLKISLDKMKDLMIDTLETLKEAKEKYHSAIESFDNLNLSIKSQNLQWEKLVAKLRSLPDTLLAGAIAGLSATIFFDIIGCLGICTTVYGTSVVVGVASNEAAILKKFEKMKRITDRIVESGHNFDKAINVAIGILNKEIDLITIWNTSAKTVNKNIDEYPVEDLKELKYLRTVFINGLDDLKNATDKFLAQPVDIFK